MGFDKARFVIHYRNGDTVIEKREDHYFWDNLPKFLYGCFNCGHKSDEGFRLHYFCDHCGTEGVGTDLLCRVCGKRRSVTVRYECPKCKSDDVSRECVILTIGIQPDPTILINDETGEPVRDATGNRLSFQLPEQVIRGSKKYEYQFFMEKLAKIEVTHRGAKAETYGMRVGMIVDKEGHCVVLELDNSYGMKMYYTTVDSLGLNFELFKINLKECGRGLAI